VPAGALGARLGRQRGPAPWSADDIRAERLPLLRSCPRERSGRILILAWLEAMVAAAAVLTYQREPDALQERTP